jgi:hypothetical protein
MKETNHKEWKVYGKTLFPSFGCFEREERKFDLGGSTVKYFPYQIAKKAGLGF